MNPTQAKIAQTLPKKLQQASKPLAQNLKPLQLSGSVATPKPVAVQCVRMWELLQQH